MTAFLIGPAEERALVELRAEAARSPVEMSDLLERLQTPDGEAEHRAQMTAQTVEIPVGFMVTFSIETGYPAGVCRHMSMSSPDSGKVPLPEAVWMVAEILGFVGSLAQCATWLEKLRGHGRAVNVVQPISFGREGAA